MFAGLSKLAATMGCWGGGEGWLHAPLPVFGVDGNGNDNCNCLRGKGVGQGGGEGELEDGFDFSCCLILLLFFWLTVFNAGQLILYQVQVNCWTGFSCKISLPVILRFGFAS
jgi:hypothetical protein